MFVDSPASRFTEKIITIKLDSWASASLVSEGRQQEKATVLPRAVVPSTVALDQNLGIFIVLSETRQGALFAVVDFEHAVQIRDLERRQHFGIQTAQLQLAASLPYAAMEGH